MVVESPALSLNLSVRDSVTRGWKQGIHPHTFHLLLARFCYSYDHLAMSSDYEFSDDEEYNEYDDDDEPMDIEDGISYPSSSFLNPFFFACQVLHLPRKT